MLGERAAGKTICPSEAARAIGGEAWREAMPAVHEAAAAMAATGEVRLTQRGVEVDAPRGAYRIRLADRPSF